MRFTNGGYSLFNDCDSHSIRCYFQNISKCPLYPNDFKPNENHITSWFGKPVSLNASLGKSKIWWNSMAIVYIMQPTMQVLRYYEKIRSALKIPHSFLTLHVRHGDKVKEAKLIPFEDYMEIINHVSI